MFLKRLIRRKSGKEHTYWALVESYRTAAGPRNRVVSYLGDLSPREHSGWWHFAGKLDGERVADPTLFEPPAAAESAARFERVRIKGVTVGRLRDFGDVYLALVLWRLLGLDKLLAEAIAPGREEIPWGVVASILSIAWFCEPSSELHIEDTWYRRTALSDLLGVRVSQVHTDRLYAGLDALLPHKDAIEAHLRSRLGELFEIKYDLLLYDVTSTYFEGDAEANPMAKRGYSRDHRPDRPQICIALVVSTEGMPLGYEVFDGNTQDSTTVKKMVEAIEKRHGKSERVWVMDRGMVSEANLQWMREEDRKYIVGTPKAVLRKFEQHLVDKDWQEVREGVQVKLVPGADGQDTFILARSEDRRSKERAMHEKFATAIEKQLEKLKKSVESGRLKDLAELNRKLGRLHERCWRAWGAFEIEAKQIEQSSGAEGPYAGKARLSITWKRNARFDQWGDLAQGCYLLRTNLNETNPATLWKHYIQLTEAEWAFRITKDELSIRPIWHHGAERTKAHVLVCFLAYVMWKTLGQWMSRSGLGRAPRTLLEEMQKIKCADVSLPVREVSQTQERLLTLRCVTTPDESQQVLLNRLGLTLPRRLQYTEELVVESRPAPMPAMKM